MTIEKSAPPYKPNVQAPYGTRKRVLQQVVADLGGLKRASHKLKISRSRMAQFAGANEPQHDPKFSLVRDMVKAGTLAPAYDLASLANADLVPRVPSVEEIHELVASHAEASGRLQAICCRAIADAVISSEELTDIHEHADAVSQIAMSVRVKAATHLDGE